MALIRAEVSRMLHRHREVIAAGAAGVAGLWLIGLGGWVLVPLGALLLGLAALWAVSALRRLRFAQGVAAPGVVEIDEGQVGYLGPGLGGYVALPDLVELRLIRLQGRRVWRLKQSDGQALLIPVEAAGAERLFDAFAVLPGLDSQALVAALEAAATGDRIVWRRDGTAPGLRLVKG
jgi:hypothetical protein